MNRFKAFVGILAMLGMLGVTAGCGDVCKKSCEKMKKCSSELKMGKMFDDVDKCVKDCKKDKKKNKDQMKAAEKCLKKDSCKDYFKCIMESAKKK